MFNQDNDITGIGLSISILRNLLFNMPFPTGQERNFNEHSVDEVDFAGGMYDFDSIMHYGNYLY